MRFVTSLPARSTVLQTSSLSSLAVKTSPKGAFSPLGSQGRSSNSFQASHVFPKGKVGTFHGFLRAQQRRHDDKSLWSRIVLLGKYGPYYDDVASFAPVELDEYWRSVAASPSIHEALQRLVADEHVLFKDHPLFPASESVFDTDSTLKPRSPPTWLTIHLIANRVLTPQHARLALDLALNQLRPTPKSYQFPMLLVAAHRLVKFQQGAYLANHFGDFLETFSYTPEFHYNELLSVCSRLTKDDTCRSMISQLISKMNQDAVSISPSISQRLSVYSAAHPSIASLLPSFKNSPSRLLNHRYQARYHISPDLGGPRRRARTGRLSKATLADAIKALNPSKGGESRPLHLDQHEWTTLISSVGRDSTIEPDALRAFWERIQTVRGSKMDIGSQTAIMDAFRQRGQYEDALLVWESILRSPGSVDKRALTAGVMTMCGLGRYKDAFDAMDAFVYKNYAPSETDTAWPESRTRWVEQRGRIPLDIPMMNGLMDRLSRAGRPDVVFKLWDVMEKYYGVWPDGITMTILLDAARRAYLIDPSMELALGQLGIFNPLKRFWARTQVAESPSSAISKLLERQPESGFWHGDWAFINARVVFRDAVLGNWPHLQDISCPVGSYSPQGVGDRLWATKDRVPEQRWPTIIPFDRTFHAYIFLLGWNELQAEIPLALAWMRALQIEPMYRTLCAALMYFGEVARLPPIFESFELRRGQEYGGDYGRLRRWIADWVGESNLPSENMIAAYRRGPGNQKMRWYGRRY